MLYNSVAELEDVTHGIVTFVKEVSHLKQRLTTVAFHRNTKKMECLRRGEGGREREGEREGENINNFLLHILTLSLSSRHNINPLTSFRTYCSLSSFCLSLSGVPSSLRTSGL